MVVFRRGVVSGNSHLPTARYSHYDRANEGSLCSDPAGDPYRPAIRAASATAGLHGLPGCDSARRFAPGAAGTFQPVARSRTSDITVPRPRRLRTAFG